MTINWIIPIQQPLTETFQFPKLVIWRTTIYKINPLKKTRHFLQHVFQIKNYCKSKTVSDLIWRETDLFPFEKWVQFINPKKSKKKKQITGIPPSWKRTKWQADKNRCPLFKFSTSRKSVRLDLSPSFVNGHHFACLYLYYLL